MSKLMVKQYEEALQEAFAQKARAEKAKAEVGRIRKTLLSVLVPPGCETGPITEDLASEVAGSVLFLRAEVARLARHCEIADATLGADDAAMGALRAEVERLRELLRRASAHLTPGCSNFLGERMIAMACEIDAALAAKPAEVCAWDGDCVNQTGGYCEVCKCPAKPAEVESTTLKKG